MNPLLGILCLASTPPAFVDVDGAELMSEIKKSTEPLIVVNVWAMWCGPCVAELPMFFSLEKQLAGKVRFMYVSTDFRSERSSAAKTFREKGGKLPGYFRRGPEGPFIDAMHPKWNGTLPATFVFDRAGRNLKFWQGMLTEAELAGTLERILGTQADPKTSR